MLDQSLTTQNVSDITGNGANQTALTGTAIATVHPPIWNRDDGVWPIGSVPPAAGGGSRPFYNTTWRRRAVA